MTDLPLFILLGGIIILMPEREVLAGLIPSESQESSPSICETHKVICETGWDCQAGILFTPVKKQLKCEADSDDCEVGVLWPNSTEVFCVRSEHKTNFGAFNGQFRNHTSTFLAAFWRQRRHRRGACIETCSSEQPCPEGESCIGNGCGHVCAKRAKGAEV